MNAVELINQNMDMRRIMEFYKFDNISGDDMVRSSCKLHDGNNPTAFVANDETGLWYCHTGSCGGGDAFTLVQAIEECEFPQAVKRVAEILGLDINGLEIADRKAKTIKELSNFIKIMQKRRTKGFKEYSTDVDIIPLQSWRNFSEGTLERFNVGYVKSIELQGKDKTYELKDRIAIPLYMDNKQIGMSLRKTKAKDYPKWSHQPKGIKTRNLLYNYDTLIGRTSAVLVEGIGDVFAYYEIGVDALCTFGAHLTDEQVQLLVKSGVEEIVLSYDGDSAGRQASYDASVKLKKKFIVSEVKLPSDSDPSDIDREELRKLYRERVRV